jgi:hypothetical protein
VTVDTTAPTLTITGGPTVTTTDTTPTITGTSDELGATVTVTITDESTQTLTAIVDDNGDWTVTIADPTEGPHTVTASVNDAAGNSASATEELTVNAPRTGGGSSGSGSNSAPTIWASGASLVDSTTSTSAVDEIRILATTQFHGATWWLAPDSLGEEREHELIPDGDEIHAAHHIPRGAK